MRTLSSKKGRPTRGIILVEIAVAVGFLAAILVGLSIVLSSTARTRRMGEIAAGTLHVLASESQRLRSLPLQHFYTGGGALRPDIVYYRPLAEVSKADGVGSGRLYGRIEVRLRPVLGATGPVQVTISCLPVYLTAPPAPTARPDIMTAAPAAFVSQTPSGLQLGALQETQTFFVL